MIAEAHQQYMSKITLMTQENNEQCTSNGDRRPTLPATLKKLVTPAGSSVDA